MSLIIDYSFFFFFNDTATTEIYTLPLHDALPIFERRLFRMYHGDPGPALRAAADAVAASGHALGSIVEVGCESGHLSEALPHLDRKSTRLNSSHLVISYAVFCLKKKNKNHTTNITNIVTQRILINIKHH